MRFLAVAPFVAVAIAQAACAAIVSEAQAQSRAAASTPCGTTRVVTIYDSHGLSSFGDALDGWYVSLPDVEVVSYTLGGASAPWLFRNSGSPRGYFFRNCGGKPLVRRDQFKKESLRTPDLAQVLDAAAGQYRRQVFVFVLGSNTPGMPSVNTEPARQVVKLLRKYPNVACVWVGPPTMRKSSPLFVEAVYAAIRAGIATGANDAAAGFAGVAPETTQGCLMIDSRPFSTYPEGGDGVHYGFGKAARAASRFWSDHVVTLIREGTGLGDPDAQPPAGLQLAGDSDPGSPWGGPDEGFRERWLYVRGLPPQGPGP